MVWHALFDRKSAKFATKNPRDLKIVWLRCWDGSERGAGGRRGGGGEGLHAQDRRPGGPGPRGFHPSSPGSNPHQFKRVGGVMETHNSLKIGSAVFRIRIRMDPFHFGLPDQFHETDQNTDPRVAKNQLNSWKIHTQKNQSKSQLFETSSGDQ